MCSFCQKETESIFQLLCTYVIVKRFWDTFRTWVSEKINTEVNINDKNIIYSAFSKFSSVLAKYYIYKFSVDIRRFEAYAKLSLILCTSSIVQFIFYFWSFEISRNILRNQKTLSVL